MKRYIYILITLLFACYLLADSRVGVGTYDARISARQAQRASVNTPPSQIDSSRVSGALSGSVYRGVVPYRSFNTPRSPYSGSYYSPVTGSLPTPVYPKTPTGLNMSNVPQSAVQLPYITRDTTGIKSGMPRFDAYSANRTLAQTYSRSVDLRPFTEDIRDFEYYLQERNLQTPQQVQSQRDMLSRKYQIDAIDKANAEKIERQDFESRYNEFREIDLEPSEDDIFEKIRQQHKEAGLEAEADAEAEENEEDGNGKQENEELDRSDKMALRNKARSVLGEFTSFAGYSNDKFNGYMKTAEDFMQQGEFYKAADAYALASIFRENDPLVYAGQALALFGAGEYMSSSFYLNKAMLIYPDYIAIKVDLVDMLGDRDVLENRIVDIKRWLERSGSGELSFLLSYVYYQMDEFEWAKQAITDAGDSITFKENSQLLSDMIELQINNK